MVGNITSTMGKVGGDIGAIDIVKVEKKFIIRDYTVNTSSIRHSTGIIRELKKLDYVEVVSISDRTFLIHLGGKISIENKVPLNTRDDLSMAYTPGVARVCLEIAKDKAKVHKLTIKKNTIAIVTDGSAVLGLGDIGPEAAIPVMEGKCMLFKRFGGVNAFPICLDTRDPDEIVDTVKRISPIFGGINLEDISSPRCFEVERKLSESLDIPVFHDDQHGTAIVVLAGVMNALKVVGKRIEEIKIVVSGLGAAGISCCRLLQSTGAKNIVGVDSAGILYRGRRNDMNVAKEAFGQESNPYNEKGTLGDAFKGADLFIGVSAPNIVTVEMLKKMSKDPIVFALANPNPEIDPNLAAPHVAIIATGRSDYQNQINNVLCFPGIFKGLLKCNARTINLEMKLAASHAIATVIGPDEISEDYIIPGVFDERVADKVAKAVVKAAIETGVARRTPK
jgi:malate dehydrogenase (oxaloacetate-decarboxylating)